MQKKIFCLVLTLNFVYFAESSPINVDILEFDNLDADYPDLEYGRDGQNWVTVFSKLFGEPTERSKDAIVSKAGEKANEKKSELKKKKPSTKGVRGTHSSGDLNTFFKIVDVQDHGTKNDADESARADATAASAAVTKGKETKTYERGTKTSGFHRVHHKDEYKKNQEFYDNDETKGSISKAIAKALGVTKSAGAGFNKSSFEHDSQKGFHGKQGNLDNGFFDKQFSEYENSEGLDGDFSDEISNILY